MPIKIDSRGVELVRTFSMYIETFGEGAKTYHRIQGKNADGSQKCS